MNIKENPDKKKNKLLKSANERLNDKIKVTREPGMPIITNTKEQKEKRKKLIFKPIMQDRQVDPVRLLQSSEMTSFSRLGKTIEQDLTK